MLLMPAPALAESRTPPEATKYALDEQANCRPQGRAHCCQRNWRNAHAQERSFVTRVTLGVTVRVTPDVESGC
jgi:hypothetical protein